MTTALLDSVYEKIMTNNTFDGMEELSSELKKIRLNSSDEEWNLIVKKTLLNHPLKYILFKDPISYRCFNKPRGYSGDAVIIDMIFQHSSMIFSNVSNIGKNIYDYTSNTPASKAVRYRKKYLARLIDDAATIKNKPNVLSLACGHVREIELSDAFRKKALGSFVGIDRDIQTIRFVKDRYPCCGITALNNSVYNILKGKCVLKDFDLIYASGLYDYLTDSVATRLTSILFNSLLPKGVLLIANFLPNIKDIGYIESYLSWHMIYRDEKIVEKLIQEVPKNMIKTIKIFREEYNNIIFLILYKEN